MRCVGRVEIGSVGGVEWPDIHQFAHTEDSDAQADRSKDQYKVSDDSIPWHSGAVLRSDDVISSTKSKRLLQRSARNGVTKAGTAVTFLSYCSSLRLEVCRDS